MSEKVQKWLNEKLAKTRELLQKIAYNIEHQEDFEEELLKLFDLHNIEVEV